VVRSQDVNIPDLAYLSDKPDDESSAEYYWRPCCDVLDHISFAGLGWEAVDEEFAKPLPATARI
jgi:hypothetical protein